MGEIADMMISGMLDYETGEYIGEGVGHPRRKRPEGVSKEDAKIKRVQAVYKINYKAAKRVRKNMLISQERALKIKELEARVKELEANLADILSHRHRKDGTLQMILEEIVEEGVL
jgi:hypothetical protein